LTDLTGAPWGEDNSMDKNTIKIDIDTSTGKLSKEKNKRGFNPVDGK
jgi:hypothetical protein